MSYRDDLAAAQARAAATERENEELREKLALVAREQQRPLVPLPEGFDVTEVGDTLTVRWSWRRHSIGSAIATLASFGLFLFGNWFLSGFTIASVIVSAFIVWIAYYPLALMLNRTTVRATARQLSVAHGPLPWRRGARIARSDLEQLFVEMGGSGHQGVTYSLCAVDRSGGKRTLIAGLPDHDQARWLEVELERHLGIPAQKVAGELIA